MKKIHLLLLFFIVAAVFISCDDISNSDTDTAYNSSADSEIGGNDNESDIYVVMALSDSSALTVKNGSFSYEITDFSCAPNEYFQFNILIKNISGEDYGYFGTYNEERITNAEVYTVIGSEKKYLKHDEMALTDDESANHVIENDREINCQLCFYIPESGDILSSAESYSLEFSYFGETIIFENIFFSANMLIQPNSINT